MVKDKDWHARRAKGIGGSDAAAVLGVSPFKSPLRLWMEKRHEIEPDDIEAKEHIYWGITLERIIGDEYARRTGRQIRETNVLSVHPQYPWMICNVDREVVTRTDAKLILEIKNVSLFHFNAAEWGPDGSTQVPAYYYTQTQHNMACTGAIQCDMPILIGGNEYRCYPIPRDARFIGELIQRELVFWDSVQIGVRPAPINLDDMRLLFPASVPGTHIDASEEAARQWAELCTAKINIGRWKKYAEQREFVIKQEMQTAEYLSFNGARLCTWKTNKAGSRVFKVVKGGAEVGDLTTEV